MYGLDIERLIADKSTLESTRLTITLLLLSLWFVVEYIEFLDDDILEFMLPELVLICLTILIFLSLCR